MKKFILVIFLVLMSTTLFSYVALAEEVCTSCEFECSASCGPLACPCDGEASGSDEAKTECVCLTDEEKADAGFDPASADGSDVETDDAVIEDEAEADTVAGTDESGESDDAEEEGGSLPLPVIGGGIGLLAIVGLIIRSILRGRGEENNPS